MSDEASVERTPLRVVAARTTAKVAGWSAEMMCSNRCSWASRNASVSRPAPSTISCVNPSVAAARTRSSITRFRRIQCATIPGTVIDSTNRHPTLPSTDRTLRSRSRSVRLVARNRSHHSAAPAGGDRLYVFDCVHITVAAAISRAVVLARSVFMWVRSRSEVRSASWEQSILKASVR